MSRKREKQPIRPLGLTENMKNRLSEPSESQKYLENRPSYPYEEQKTEKTAFHPRMMSKKQQILRFIHG